MIHASTSYLIAAMGSFTAVICAFIQRGRAHTKKDLMEIHVLVNAQMKAALAEIEDLKLTIVGLNAELKASFATIAKQDILKDAIATIADQVSPPQ